MKPIYKDTTLEAKRVQFQILRDIGIEKRAEMTFNLSDEVRALAEAGIRLRHPEYDVNRVRLELIRLVLGQKLFNEVYNLKKSQLE